MSASPKKDIAAKMAKPSASRPRAASMLSRIWAMMMHRDKTYSTWILGLVQFEKDVGVEPLKAHLVEKILKTMPRFRSKYDFKKDKFIELAISDIDLDMHIKVDTQLKTKQEIISKYMGNVKSAFEIDIDRPLWQIVYFPQLSDNSALFLTLINHCIGDGISQIEVLNSLMDPTTVPATELHAVDLEFDENTEALTTPPQHKLSVSQKLTKVRKLSHGFGPLNRIYIFFNGIFRALVSALARPDSIGPLKKSISAKPSENRSFAFTEVIPLDKVKELRHKYNATVNDILVSVLTMAVHSYLKDKPGGEAFISGKKKFRASFPINMRKRNEPAFDSTNSPHNSAAMGIFSFPLKYTSRTQLVYTVKRELDQLKISPMTLVQKHVVEQLFKVVSKNIQTTLFSIILNQTSGMLSNVVGPQTEAKILDTKIIDLQFGVYAPISVYLGLISYNNRVNCCVCLDEELGKAEDLAKYWKPEFEKLCEETAKEEINGQVPKKTTFATFWDRF